MSQRPQADIGKLLAAYPWLHNRFEKQRTSRTDSVAFSGTEGPGKALGFNKPNAKGRTIHIATGTNLWGYPHQLEHVGSYNAPLGIERWYWKRTPAGVVDTEGGLYLEARDLAKIWYLFLKDGKWDGRQVVSPAWVRASITPAIAVSAQPGAPKYGYKWWLYAHPRDSTRLVWAGSGFGGQVPMALEEEDLILVFNGWNILPGRPSLPRGRVLARIVAGITDR